MNEERRRLHRLLQQQSLALATSTRQMQILRVAHDQKVRKVHLPLAQLTTEYPYNVVALLSALRSWPSKQRPNAADF